jgi:uncharacterized protein
MPPSRPHDSHLVRILFITGGCVALLLAVAGVFLPILPTTPFVLVAAGCFARGSERLHTRLLAHRVAGPIISAWEEHRSMPPGVKPWAFALLGISFGFSIFTLELLWQRLILGALAIGLAIGIWRVPVRAP